MKKQSIENAALRLRGVEQILLHLSVSDYIIQAGDAELFQILMDDVRQARIKLDRALNEPLVQKQKKHFPK